MDELTLGLIGAGAVVVGGVVVYNAWQGAKVRRRMPRPMPEEAAEAMNRPERDEELPFIEPVRQPVRREPAAPVATLSAVRLRSSCASTTRASAASPASDCGTAITPLAVASDTSKRSRSQSISGSQASACRRMSSPGASAR